MLEFYLKYAIMKERKETKEKKMKHHINAKTKGTFLGFIYSATLGKLSCYESHIFGDEYPIIIFNQNGVDLTDEMDAWDMETIRDLAA